jgi:ribonuclease P protein component
VLAAAERLRRRDEFAATIKSGGRASRGAVVVHVSTRSGETSDPARNAPISQGARAGFVVSKAVGGAVVRNKVKRRLRHLTRPHLANLPAGTDLVVRALPNAASRSYHDLDADLTQALRASLKRSGRGRR